MPKVKVPRKSTAIDMTAMTDVAFLLLTFFMLTSNFIQNEPVMVTIPSSISQLKIPETNILTILIDETGKIFIGMDGEQKRMEWLKKVGADYNMSFTPQESKAFSLVNSFGVPIGQMADFLALTSKEREMKENLLGIPADSTNNQFKDWVREARIVNPQIRIAIKADESTPYPAIKNVMNTLRDIDENRYDLITAFKKKPKITES